MSYILDALRRADVERERGAVPGLHTQVMPPLPAEPEGRPTARPWLWLVAGLSAGLVGALAWHFAAPQTPAVIVATAPSVAPMVPAPSTSVAPAPIVPQSPPPTAVAVTPTPASTPSLKNEPPPAAPPVRTAPRPATKAALAIPDLPRPAHREAPVTTATAAQLPAKAKTPVIEEKAANNSQQRIYARDELPADIRQQLPSLTVGGSMYSERPALRMVIINGQLLHEGDQPMPGLVLSHIRPKSAVFQFKGYKYEIAY